MRLGARDQTGPWSPVEMEQEDARGSGGGPEIQVAMPTGAWFMTTPSGMSSNDA